MTKKRAALGRGLSALLDNTQSPTRDLPKPKAPTTVGNVAGEIAMLSIAQIVANPFQPRTQFDETALHELADSIGKLGIIQPITVRKIGVRKYELISGERRFRASQLAGLEEVPAYIREANDQEMLEMALVENIQRENLDAMEIAFSYKRLIEECDLTQVELSERVGKNRSTISNYMRLLKLPADVQMGIIEKKLSMGHARALVNAGEEKVQLKVYQQILQYDLSVRKTEDLVRKLTSGELSSVKKTETKLSLNQRKSQEDLRERFGPKAKISPIVKGQGKLEIPYTNESDLQDILDALGL